MGMLHGKETLIGSACCTTLFRKPVSNDDNGNKTFYRHHGKALWYNRIAEKKENSNTNSHMASTVNMTEINLKKKCRKSRAILVSRKCKLFFFVMNGMPNMSDYYTQTMQQ